MKPHQLQALAREWSPLEHGGIVDAYDTLMFARAVKTPTEIDLLRRATALNRADLLHEMLESLSTVRSVTPAIDTQAEIRYGSTYPRAADELALLGLVEDDQQRRDVIRAGLGEGESARPERDVDVVLDALALAQADVEFREFKRNLLGGTYRAFLAGDKDGMLGVMHPEWRDEAVAVAMVEDALHLIVDELEQELDEGLAPAWHAGRGAPHHQPDEAQADASQHHRGHHGIQVDRPEAAFANRLL